MEFETKVKIASGILAVSALSLGGFIYLSYRTRTLVVFDLLDSLHLSCLVSLLRSDTDNLAEWIKFSLPDGLWVFTYVLYIGIVYSFKTDKCKLMVSVLPIIGIVSEFLQYARIIPGTFDVIDLLAYTIGGLVGLGYINIVKQLILKRKEV